MKNSFYNIAISYKDKYLIFNSLTRHFFFVSKRNKKAFLAILSTPERYKAKYYNFIDKMLRAGFIVENDVNERRLVLERYDNMRKGNMYKLMIMPTYACNVHCWYCTQNHQSMTLKHQDVKLIKKHIEYYLIHNEIKHLSLAWFGGEPLINFRHVADIASYAQNFCKLHKIGYNNTITTNGMLLTKEMLHKMKLLNFTFFQITVDGTKKEHDNVKVIRGKSSYEQIMHNITLITHVIPEAEICLRYNFTMKNLKPEIFLRDLNEHLDIDVRKHVSLSLMKVWQENDNTVNRSLLTQLADNAIKDGYRVSIGGGFGICYVDKYHFNCIFPNGLVDKCDNDDPESCRGYISDEGKIVWNEKPKFFANTIVQGNNECKRCVYLPICNGPCPRERDRGKTISCRFADKKGKKENDIITYVESVMRKRNV